MGVFYPGFKGFKTPRKEGLLDEGDLSLRGSKAILELPPRLDGGPLVLMREEWENKTMGSVSFAGKQATEREYNIKARVMKLRKGFTDSRGRKLEADMVLLIPRMEDTECIRFMMAWQPLDVEEAPGVPQHFELSAFVTTPGLHTATRLAILPPGPLCKEQPYLTVMSVGPKTRLESKDGEMVDLKILGEGEDEVADEAIPE